VVRHASSGCKEWAEGLAREVEFVQGDWAALGWAVGSTRVLLNRAVAPMTSLADVRDGVRGLSKWLRRRTSGYAFLFFYAFYNTMKMMGAGSVQLRSGYGFLAAAATFSVITLLLRRRMQQAPDGDDLVDWVRYYRFELEGQRDFYRSRIGMASYAVLIGYFTGGYLVCSAFIPRSDVRSDLLLGWMGALVIVLMIGCLISSSIWEWLRF
jgi:hypothetical protein